MADRKIPIKEIAAREDVSYLTALRWVQAGKLKGVYKGGRWEVMESEYNRFAKEGNRTIEETEKVEKEAVL